MTLVRTLTELRELYLRVERIGESSLYHDPLKDPYGARCDPRLGSFFRLHILPFEHITAIFGNSASLPRGCRPWSDFEKKVLADTITRLLLDPNGEEYYDE